MNIASITLWVTLISRIATILNGVGHRLTPVYLRGWLRCHHLNPGLGVPFLKARAGTVWWFTAPRELGLDAFSRRLILGWFYGSALVRAATFGTTMVRLDLGERLRCEALYSKTRKRRRRDVENSFLLLQ